MNIVQKTITTIVADEGKLLVRKSDGALMGNRITLGYDYYDAGFPLAKPRLMTPEHFTEIDKPEDYDTKPTNTNAPRMKRILALLDEEKRMFSERGLTASEMLEVKDLAYKWGVDIKEGDSVTKRTKFTYNGKLYSVLKEHTVLPYYAPSDNTVNLYVEVTEDFVEDTTDELNYE